MNAIKTENEKRILQKLKNSFEHYALRCLKIRSKSGDILPFQLNKAQLHVHSIVERQKIETGKVRALVLKGRQQGMSTYIEGRYYWLVTHRFGVKAFILTHDKGATDNLFEMAQRYHQHCPEIVRPEASTNNAKELYFGGLDSGYKIGTAGNKAVGRSATIQYFHGSEVGFWPNASEHSKGIMQAVPNEKGTEIFLESTANGVGNYFHEQWQLAESKESDFKAIFVPWFWQPEYQREFVGIESLEEDELELIDIYKLTLNQLMWRRYKIQELSASGGNGKIAFNQEYPNNSTEAFTLSGEDTLISSEIVMRARKSTVEAIGPLVIGVDPARFGDDRTSIIYRRGRVAYNLQSHLKKNAMEVTGIIHKIIKEDSPDKVFIDVANMGSGIIDRLRELGFVDIVCAVNSGENALDQDLYPNKRAEMWGLCKKWLEQIPVKIPDVDSLHADLCGLKYKFDSLTRIVPEPKPVMKKRGLRSPDEADALCLTFAFPIDNLVKSANNAELIASKILSHDDKLYRLRANR